MTSAFAGEARVEAPVIVVDLDALLVALVLAPTVYSRNRFYELYKEAGARRVRRRASSLRSVLRQLARGRKEGATPASFDVRDDGSAELSYAVPSLVLKRTVQLEPLELSVIRFVLAIANGAPGLPTDHPDRIRVETALARLSPT